MSRRKFERRRSRYRIWYALGVTYCWSFFLNLALFVLRIGYIDTGPDSADPDVALDWRVRPVLGDRRLVGKPRTRRGSYPPLSTNQMSRLYQHLKSLQP
jgi:hypothetical protein